MPFNTVIQLFNFLGKNLYATSMKHAMLCLKKEEKTKDYESFLTLKKRKKKTKEKVRCNADLTLGATTSTSSYVPSGTQNHDLKFIFTKLCHFSPSTYL